MTNDYVIFIITSELECTNYLPHSIPKAFSFQHHLKNKAKQAVADQLKELNL